MSIMDKFLLSYCHKLAFTYRDSYIRRTLKINIFS